MKKLSASIIKGISLIIYIIFCLYCGIIVYLPTGKRSIKIVKSNYQPLNRAKKRLKITGIALSILFVLAINITSITLTIKYFL